MQELSVYYLSTMPHNAQILTGFRLLGNHVTISDGTRGALGIPAYPAAIVALYRGKKLIYDTGDSYHDIKQMGDLLKSCDFYFKRSFSPDINRQHFGEYAHKLYPLGLNYHVTYPGSPLNIHRRLRRRIKAYFTPCFAPKVFEGQPKNCCSAPKILFYTRLWAPNPQLSERLNREREQINQMRIQIIRRLKEAYGKSFWGGVEKSDLAETLCPDLILPRSATRRHSYLRKLHCSDICIGTAGLHGSIGWKTGEYIAAAKAVVCEKPVFTVPGELPYLPFETVEECLTAVESLISDPDYCLAMQKKSYSYYQNYLKPEVLIQNTLSIVDNILDA